jgi:leucyl-tRNA synthetase
MSKEKPHYVNNADFSQAVVDYVQMANECVARGEPKPVIPNYVAECFLKIAEGLSHKANFVRYTYREEMVMDAVENCLKAIDNYNLETATRTGKPNAFAYFTQISWYAFLRRIEKEKRQQDIKIKYITEAGMQDLIAEEIDNDESSRTTQAFVDELRGRIDIVRETDRVFKEYAKSEKRKRKGRSADSDLSEFLAD